MSALIEATATIPCDHDARLLALSDELILHVLSYLSPARLLGASLACKRLYQLSSDSQLWRVAYYDDFVVPRLLRPRVIAATAAAARQRARKVWRNGQKCGRDEDAMHKQEQARLKGDHGRERDSVGHEHDAPATATTTAAARTMNLLADAGWPRRRWRDGESPCVDWKARYKLRHNWAQGQCALDEVDMDNTGGRSLVKIADGIAVTAGAATGLRAWDLRKKRMITQVDLDGGDDVAADSATSKDTNKTTTTTAKLRPRSLALDGRGAVNGGLDVVVGFEQGRVGLWRLDLERGQLVRRHVSAKVDDAHQADSEVVALAYSHPYLLTATSTLVISLYAFPTTGDDCDDGQHAAPALITRLKSHLSSSSSSSSSSPSSQSSPSSPIALSIRQTAPLSRTASVAYTFSSLGGWCIGIQSLQVKERPPGGAGGESLPVVSSSCVAFTSPHPHLPTRPARSAAPSLRSPARGSRMPHAPPPLPQPGPTTVCYNHPYLLAALPDNTLVLHLCTATASTLTLSSAIRLWGHTSGISDADVTERGRAVSVSRHGDEVRVWELEGGRPGSSFPATTTAAAAAAVRKRKRGGQLEHECEDGRSVAVRPRGGSAHLLNQHTHRPKETQDDDDRRDWVGFDDETVLVLKQASDGRESLMVYDFT